MKAKQHRPAKILEFKADPKNPKVTKYLVVAAASVHPVSPFAFLCFFCNQVHTDSEPQCKNPSQFVSVKDNAGRTRKLSPQWQFLVELQNNKDRALAGDLSDWLHSMGLEWAPL